MQNAEEFMQTCNISNIYSLVQLLCFDLENFIAVLTKFSWIYCELVLIKDEIWSKLQSVVNKKHFRFTLLPNKSNISPGYAAAWVKLTFVLLWLCSFLISWLKYNFCNVSCFLKDVWIVQLSETEHRSDI